MSILALDIATKTGWCCGEYGGAWDFSVKRDESKDTRLLRFKAQLIETCILMKPSLVVFERLSGRHVNSIIVQAEMHGAMKVTLAEYGFNYRAFSASEIKKFATGKGNAGKPQMIQACIDKLNITPIDDNHADAIWLHELASDGLKYLG